MAINTYLLLKDAIENWAKRGDILSVIDDFIDLAESDMWQAMHIRDMEARATAAAPTADRFMALPDDFLSMRKMAYTAGGIQMPLIQKTPEAMQVQNTAGRPAAFTVTSQLEFDRTPDSAYTTEMHYYKELTPLSATNASNAILLRFPQVYLYGSLFHFAQWAHNDIMLAKYSTLFDDAMNRANRVDRRGRHGPAPAMRTEASTP